jgi:outer membrane protein with glycine zipper
VTKHRFAMILLVMIATTTLALAQAPPASTGGGQKTLAATMNVQVFPSNGQAADQQSKDEAECYNWAVGNTGTDPFELSKQAQAQQQQADQAKQQAQQAGKGAGAGGAVKGAAVGAAVGAIAGDTGKGAAIGAGAGVVAGRRKGKEAQKQAAANVDQKAAQANQATKEQMDNFKKAFGACLEGKKYIAKY